MTGLPLDTACSARLLQRFGPEPARSGLAAPGRSLAAGPPGREGPRIERKRRRQQPARPAPAPERLPTPLTRPHRGRSALRPPAAAAPAPAPRRRPLPPPAVPPRAAIETAARAAPPHRAPQVRGGPIGGAARLPLRPAGADERRLAGPGSPPPPRCRPARPRGPRGPAQPSLRRLPAAAGGARRKRPHQRPHPASSALPPTPRTSSAGQRRPRRRRKRVHHTAEGAGPAAETRVRAGGSGGVEQRCFR
ncbi:basic proline-rich protein-like [Gallus gallus]|uniref:basic proline-rich protein-like n=1 Tax=Gallus gallus TaxID=9031 RepID=UPI001AE568AF|nr:basic proline-rich protein-like [Gallus gallus]XP_046786832.1 basic proline-rich protein-like [Gallus gallus]